MMHIAEINEIKNRLRAMWLAANGKVGVIDTDFTFHGLIRIRELPFDSYEEYARWWLPQRNESGAIIAQARMTQQEKERYTALEARNLLTGSGRTQILGFIGTPTYVASQSAFAQYFSVGTYPFTTPSSGDTTTPGELARATPSTAVITGTQIDIATFFATGAANGGWTNAGLWGVNATSTLGSGTLMTHSAFAYTKSSSQAVTVDYLISLT